MKQRINPIVLTAILAISAFVVFTASVASAATIYVPEGGNQTIQAAVNNATAGDTITVRDGTYNENVDVGTAHLTIQSQNGSANCIVNASDPDDYVFNVTADYVNITGFTVTGATGNDKAGIYLGSNVDHCTISENNASNNNYGISLSSSSNNNLTSNNASNNYCGISLSSSSNNNLTSNTANSNNYCGIYLSSSSNNNLTSNTANSNNNYGIYLRYSSNNNLTSNTANSNNKYGIWLSDSSNNNLTSNTANNSNEWHGIRMSYSSNNNLTSNTANSNNYCGIYMLSSSNNNLTSNTANSNNELGIYLRSSSNNNNVSCNWVQNNSEKGFRLSTESTNNTIERNNIIANGVSQVNGSYQYQFYNDQTNDVEAKHNYWGAGMNNSTINASIYDWQDNHDKGNVTFLPKLTGPDPCAPIPELSTIALLAVGLLMLAGYVRIGRKKDE